MDISSSYLFTGPRPEDSPSAAASAKEKKKRKKKKEKLPNHIISTRGKARCVWN